MVKKGKSARLKGHRLERSVKEDFIQLGYTKCITTRQGSRELDAYGIDLMHTGDFDIQCKSIESAINIPKEIKKIEQINKEHLKIIIHKRNRKVYAYMRYSDLLQLIKYYERKVLDGGKNNIY